MRSELPELSPVNWTSFATGCGPERHGVFGFTRLDPVEYVLRIADSSIVAAPTIFELLGARGLVSRVINLPNTYPARPLRGMLIAGFVAPELTRATYPPFLAAQLTRLGYRLEPDTVRGARDHAFLLAELQASLESRRRALDLLWPDLAWDVFVFVLTETDRLFHFLYPAVLDATHPLHDACLDFLSAWDCLIAELLERFEALPSPKRLLVLADHGFTALRQEVDLNAWLRRQGWLRLGAPPAHELDARSVLPETRAFALDPGRIYLHVRDHFSRGQLRQSEAGALLRELREALLGLTCAGEPVMEEVFFGDELYPGAAQRFGPGWRGDVPPDLVCLARPGFDLKAKFDRNEVFGLYGRLGTHSAADAFFWDSQGSAPARVRDVGQEVLRHFGLAVEADAAGNAAGVRPGLLVGAGRAHIAS